MVQDTCCSLNQPVVTQPRAPLHTAELRSERLLGIQHSLQRMSQGSHAVPTGFRRL
jgi:hypothetical protein